MKYTKLAILLSATAAILAGCGDSADSGPKLWPVLLIILSLALLALAGLRTYSIIQYNRRRAKSSRRRRPRSLDPMTIGMFALAALLLFGSLLGSCNGNDTPDSTADSTPPTETGNDTPVSLFVPKAADDAHPNNWGIRWEIIESGKIVHSYNRQEPITLGNPEDYFTLPGVATFREITTGITLLTALPPLRIRPFPWHGLPTAPSFPAVSGKAAVGPASR